MTDTTTTAPALESMQYRTEVKQLLNILAHSLYTDREIFLRELISNASDALNRIQFELLTNHDVLDHDRELAIWLETDREAHTLTIRDSGIGMTHDELIENLGTIAHSGAKTFLANAQEKQATLEEIIGQFGVGFYSVFMVAEQVSVTSRSFLPDAQAWTWTSSGESDFTLTPADKADRGTTIVITLKHEGDEDAADFANTWRIEQVVKKHSDYVSFPIYLVETKSVRDDEGEETGETETTTRMINRRKALWRQAPREVEDAAEYNEFYKQLTYDFSDPTLHVHLVTDAPVNVRSLLFVPSKRERSNMMGMNREPGLKLYSRKVLIQERNTDLLPEYLRFVEGVVDSEDLPLNVSRETVQSNPVMRQLKKALSGRVIKELKKLADEEPAKYREFWGEFGVFLKEGAATDFASRDSVVDLLRFHSSKTENPQDLVSAQEVIDRMPTDQTEIYYVLGESLKSVARSPHLDYFRANGVEVLYLVDPIDGFMTTGLREIKGKTLKNVDDAGLDLPEKSDEDEATDKPEAVDASEFTPLVDRFKAVLGERVVDVRESKQLVDNPARLVSPEDSYDRDMQRIRRLMEQDYEVPKKILELNRRHSMVANLAHMVAADAESALVDAAIEQLFDNALLLEGLHPNPADMAARIQMLMEAAVAGRSQK